MESVLIFRRHLLPVSETFILGQAVSLRRFRPQFAGIRRAKPSLQLPSEPILIREDDRKLSRFRSLVYKKTGVAPSFLKRIAAIGPSCIHAHFAPDALEALPIAKSLKIPLIVTLHGYDVTAQSEIQRDYRSLWSRASIFLCVSEFIRRKAIECGFPEDKLRLHYIGIDCERFASQAVEREPDSVLFVGRLVEKKGCEDLLRAMRRVQAAIPTARLTVIGDGHLKERLIKMATEFELNFTFLGSQDAAAVSEHMARCSVFCAPSVTAPNGDSEGFGMVFLEAQAVGTPVVSTIHGGIPEAVADGQSGLLGPEGDEESLAKNIVTLLKDDSLRKQFGEFGAHRVRQSYNLLQQTHLLEDFYSEALGRGPLLRAEGENAGRVDHRTTSARTYQPQLSMEQSGFTGQSSVTRGNV